MDAQLATRRWQRQHQRSEDCDWCGSKQPDEESMAWRNWVVILNAGNECVSVFCPACADQYHGVKRAFDTVSELLMES